MEITTGHTWCAELQLRECVTPGSKLGNMHAALRRAAKSNAK